MVPREIVCKTSEKLPLGRATGTTATVDPQRTFRWPVLENPENRNVQTGNVFTIPFETRETDLPQIMNPPTCPRSSCFANPLPTAQTSGILLEIKQHLALKETSCSDRSPILSTASGPPCLKNAPFAWLWKGFPRTGPKTTKAKLTRPKVDLKGTQRYVFC